MKYLVIFLIVYIKMGVALLYLDGKDLGLSQVPILVGVSLASDSQVMDRGNGGVWCCTAVMRCSRSRYTRCVICHFRASNNASRVEN